MANGAVTKLGQFAVTPERMAFIDEYMRNGREAGQAYATSQGIPMGNAASRSASRWLARPEVVAEVNRRIEEYSRTAGIERVQVLEFLKAALFCDTRKAFAPGGGILPPAQWSDDLEKLVAGYNSGTVTAAEKITFESRVDIAFKLLEELKPLGERAPLPGATNVQINVDKLLLALDAPLPTQ